VYVTHDQAEAMALSDRIVVMQQGRVVQVGTAYDVYRHPLNAFVADFIGKANLLPVRVVGVSPERLDLEVLGRPLSVPSTNGVYRVGEPATLLVRPEAMLLLERSGEGYPGRVRRTAYLGPLVEYDVDVADTALCLTQYDPRQVYPIGTEVCVQFVTEALYLLPPAVSGPSPSGREL